MLNEMRLIAAIIENESLNQAAEVLQVSQPALSRQLRKMEEEWRVTLFHRQGKRLVLTRMGQITYEYAQKFLQMEQEFLQTIGSFRSIAEGHRLKIGASLTTLQSTLPNLLTHFVERSPSVEVQVQTGKTHEIALLSEQRRIDLGIIASHIEHSSLICQPLFEDHLCLIAPEQKQKDWVREKITLNALNNLPMVLFSKDTLYRVLLDKIFNQHGIYPDVRMEIDSFEAIARLVATGAVYSLLPKSYLREGMTSVGYSVWEIDELSKAKRITSLIYPAKEKLSYAVQSFIETATSLYKT